MSTIPDNCPTVKTEQTVRAELAHLQARYDSGAVSPAIFAANRELEIELAWFEHRGQR
jgi:hypothetical protein